MTARELRGTDWAPSSKESIANEAIPKSAQRVFNALGIREDFKTKKRKTDDEQHAPNNPGKRRKLTDGAQAVQKLKILPGESIQHFNRRVEDDLRPLVKSAMEAGRAVSRKVVQEELEAKKQAKQNAQSKSTNSKSKLTKKTASAEEGPIGEGGHKPTPTPASDASRKRSASPRPSVPLPPVEKHADRPKEFAATSTSAPKRLNDIAQAPPELKKLPRGAAASLGRPGKTEGVLSMAQKAMMEQERSKAIARYRELKALRKQNSDTPGNPN